MLHTRWIENDFKQELKPTKRGIPNHQQPMLLSYIEIDGKLHRLGLPAGMFAQRASNRRSSPNSRARSQCRAFTGTHQWCD
ncbi:hypothetical protein ABVN80_17540 [Acinetobacter baumannii]